MAASAVAVPAPAPAPPEFGPFEQPPRASVVALPPQPQPQYVEGPRPAPDKLPVPDTIPQTPAAEPVPQPDAAVAESADEGLEKVSRDLEKEADARAAVDAVVATTAVAAAGYVLLNTRAVYWFLSALLARPAVWRRFDPIAVIYAWESERELGKPDGTLAAPENGESLQSIVG